MSSSLKTQHAAGNWLQRMDADLRAVFQDHSSTAFKRVSNFLTTLIFASVFFTVMDTVVTFREKYHAILDVVEWTLVAIFTVEYLLNIYTAPDRKAYIFGLWGVIDLMSVLPSYANLGNISALKVLRQLRILRFMRILRILKLARGVTESLGKTANAETNVRMNLTIYGVSLFTVIMISSTLMYFAEGNNEGTLFTSIPQAMWWSVVTVTTVGYGDMYPVTVGGRLVAAVTMFAGLCLFAVLFNVVGKVLMKALFGQSDLESTVIADPNAAPVAAPARRTGKAGSCACGRGLEADWRLCPHCGLLVT